MEWLGIHIPEDIKEELKACSNAVGRSVEIAAAIASDLIDFCQARSIPFGFNVESVAIRKEEVEASVELLTILSGLLKRKGLRNGTKLNGIKPSAGVYPRTPLLASDEGTV